MDKYQQNNFAFRDLAVRAERVLFFSELALVATFATLVFIVVSIQIGAA